MSGRLSSSMVELVVKVATPEDEAGWVERAQAMTVRALRAELRAAKVALVDDEAPARVTITRTVDTLDAWAFERARMMVETVGAMRGDEAVEAMLAEGLTEVLVRHPGLDLPSGLTEDMEAEARAWRAELAAIREAAEAAAESLTSVEGVAPERSEPVPEIAWPEELLAIDLRLREAARELAWRDLELAELGRRAAEHGVWKALGYLSFDQYCRERVGVSPAGMATRVALARRVVELPEVESAVVEGRIGYEAAALIARVAGGGTVEAWIGRAERRTVKLLREEIEAVEMLARAEGLDEHRLGPPEAALLESIRAIERGVIAAVTWAAEGADLEARCSATREEGQMSGGEVGTTTLRLTVSEDTGRFWRTLEALHGGLGEDGSFVAFLVRAVMRSWSGAVPTKVAYGDVYLRDRWRCASPVCRSRSVTPHHVRFRSRGGGEERGNLVSLCERCHLELVHGDRLAVTGVAPGALEWRAAGWRVTAG